MIVFLFFDKKGSTKIAGKIKPNEKYFDLL
jgi:hypothetical protein